MGAIGLIGNFEGISLLDDANPSSLQPNQSAILQYKDNSLYPIGLLSSNSLITSFCSINLESNSKNSILFVGGKILEINSNKVSNLAKFSTISNKWESVKWGLQGIVSHLLCHQKEQLVTIVGSFKSALLPGFIYSPETLSTYTPSIIQYNVTDDSWASFPFKGLNGPVTSIASVPNSDRILIGGDFQSTADGNLNSNGVLANQLDLRLAKVSSENLIRGAQSSPYNVICGKNPWLLEDNTKGSLKFDFPYPVKFVGIQLVNSNLADRSTKQFSVMATPSNQFYNISYIDGQGSWATCGSACPLQLNSNTAQSFFFVNNTIPATTGIQINIQEWYGFGGGLGSVKLFVEDAESLAQATIYTSNCPGLQGQTQSAVKGSWQTSSYPNTNQLYLSYSYKTDQSNWNTLNQTISEIHPNIPEFGKYNLQLTFPPCSQLECKKRGQLQVTVADNSGTNVWGSSIIDLGSGKSSATFFEGFLPPSGSNNSPRVFIRPVVLTNGQDERQVMVQSVKVNRLPSKTDLNGILSIHTTAILDPFSSNMQEIENKMFPEYPTGLPGNFRTTALAVVDPSRIMIAGDVPQGDDRKPKLFISQGSDIESIQFQDGLGVISRLISASKPNSGVFAGGAFKFSSNDQLIENFGFYNLTTKKWTSIPRLQVKSLLNMISKQDDLYLVGEFIVGESLHTGLGTKLNFIRINQYTFELESDTLISGDVKSVGTDQSSIYFGGQFANVQTYRSPGLAILNSTGLASNTHSIDQPSASFLNWGQIKTAAFYNLNSDLRYQSDHTLTVVAGGFESEKVSKVAILDNGNWKSVFKKDELKGDVHCVEFSGNRMLIGGAIENPKGDKALLMYDLVRNEMITSPPALQINTNSSNSNAIVRDLLRLPDSSIVVAAGHFDTASGTSCPNVCFYDTQKETWSAPDSYNGKLPEFAQLALLEDWIVLLPTPQSSLSYLLGYNTKSKEWKQFGQGLPGIPTRVHYHTDTNRLYVSGSSTQNSNGSVFLTVWDGQKFAPIVDKLSGSKDIQSVLVVPITSASPPPTTLNLSHELPNGLGLLISGDLIITSNLQTYSSVLYYQGQYYPQFVASPVPSFAKLITTLPYRTLEELSLPLPLIILISLAISLTIVSFIVCTGLGILWYRNHKTYRSHQNNVMPFINSNEFLLHPSIFDSHTRSSPGTLEKKHAVYNIQDSVQHPTEFPEFTQTEQELSPIHSETVVDSEQPHMEIRRLDDVPSGDTSYEGLPFPQRPQSLAALTASTTYRSVHTSLSPSSRLRDSDSGDLAKSTSVTTSSEGFTAESPSRKAMNRLSEAFPNLAQGKAQRASINTSSPTRLQIKSIPVKRVSQALTLPEFSIAKSIDQSNRSSYKHDVE